eukprot:3459858-Pyramimonas_sp.AAC.1
MNHLYTERKPFFTEREPRRPRQAALSAAKRLGASHVFVPKHGDEVVLLRRGYREQMEHYP